MAQQPAHGGQNRSGTTDHNGALLRAAYAADNARVIAALEDGADVNTADPVTGLTALHIAAGTNNLHLTRILVEDWRAEFKPDGQGRWPSVVAALSGVDEVLADYIVEAEAKAISAE
jgi:hypothetical protein